MAMARHLNYHGGSKMEWLRGSPPAWENLDPETLRRARLGRALLRILIVLTSLAYLNVPFNPNHGLVFLLVSSFLAAEVLSWWLLQRGRVQAAFSVLSGGLWAALSLGTFLGSPQGNAPWIGLSLVVLIAGILLGSRAATIVAGLNTLSGLGFLLASQNNLLPQPPLLPYNPISLWISLSLIFFIISGLISLSNTSVQQALEIAAANQRSLEEANRELEAMRASLEAQVAERTQELQRRSAYLQAGVEVSRATASILEVERLMSTAVEVIRQQFDLYYVGLFTVDSAGEYAVLQAGTGEAGRKMLERGHRIRVGSGMIGWSIANAQPRIALDVGKDAVRLATPELPETRSEAAIPLRSRGRVLGALTVQSTQPNAFGDMEIAVFEALADQLAIALDNARLFEESQQALKETQRLYGQISRRAWQEFLHASGIQGMSYRYGRLDTRTDLTQDKRLEQIQHEVMTKHQPQQVTSDGKADLLIPILVRDQSIGVMRFSKEIPELLDGHPAWQEDEIALLQTLCDQVGAALESARLYHEAQRLAYREQITSDVANRIRQTLDVQTVLRTAVEEIQRTLNLPEVTISIAPPPEEPIMPSEIAGREATYG